MLRAPQLTYVVLLSINFLNIVIISLNTHTDHFSATSVTELHGASINDLAGGNCICIRRHTVMDKSVRSTIAIESK